MPEFEETNPSSSAETYAPSTDAKPRSRRRSGGFKKEPSAAASGNIGEIDPAEALRGERLSGEAEAHAEASNSRPARETTRDTESVRADRSYHSDDSDRADPQPTEDTLATVKRVEARILERKAERDARHQARKKERPANSESSYKRNAPKKSGGFFTAILKLFGLGPKTPARKSGGRGGSRGGRGGQRGGQNRGSRGGNRNSRGGRGRNPRGSARRD
ncbi:MAG: hypothetical protein GWO81_06450 [Verrucomicrobia bacterium]|nr:hypothetical protein [Verrucomicrobiota bacterium]